MTTKLTLTIKKSTIEKAKVYAKETQRSLSEMVQKYLESLVDDQIEENDNTLTVKKVNGKLKFPSHLEKYIGIAKVPKDYSDEDLEKDRREYLEEKYL